MRARQRWGALTLRATTWLAAGRVLAAVVVLALGTGCLAFHKGALPGEPKTATFMQVGDARVRYVDTAASVPERQSAETVVLVHGFGASIEEWGLLIQTLSKSGYRVVAMDLKGHGWTDRPEGDYSIQSQARLVVTVADQLKVDKFVVVGHSWGSSVAMSVALMAGERVTRIALYNGMLFQEQQPLMFSWSRVPGLGEYLYGVLYKERQDEKIAFAFYDKEKHVDEKMVESLERFMDRPGTEAAALATIRAMDHSHLQKRYKDVRQPTLLLWGREDQVTPVGWGERMLRELPNGRLVVFPQCGHLPMIEVAGASSNELLRFLAEGKK